MRSFDDLVDAEFKPQALLKVEEKRCEPKIFYKITYGEPVGKSWKDILFGRYLREEIDVVKCYGKDVQEILHEKYYYAKTLKLPYYGADLHEPVIKICKRILEHPNRFSVVKKGVVGSTYHYTDALGTTYHLHAPIGIEGPQVLIDKDTKQKFVFEYEKCKNLSFLTDTERRFLYTVVMEWWQDEEERLKEKSLRKAQKQKEKFRQELIDVYKDY